MYSQTPGVAIKDISDASAMSSDFSGFVYTHQFASCMSSSIARWTAQLSGIKPEGTEKAGSF